MSKYWHILATVGLAALSVLTPGIRGALSSHTIVATVLASVWAVLGSVLPSPVLPKAN